jgi:hypothetical protein
MTDMSCNEVPTGNECYLLALHTADLTFKSRGSYFLDGLFERTFKKHSCTLSNGI